MSLISKPNGIFFYLSGLIILFLTYAFFEPFIAANASQIEPQTLASAVALIKLFYAFGAIFIVLGVFIFALASIFPKKRKSYM